MVKVIEPAPPNQKWSTKIRCAAPVFGYSKPHRVDGCFSILEITYDDIKCSYRTDSDGDEQWTITVTCPVCNTVQYPAWQIGDGAIEVIKKMHGKKR